VSPNETALAVEPEPIEAVVVAEPRVAQEGEGDAKNGYGRLRKKPVKQ